MHGHGCDMLCVVRLRALGEVVMAGIRDSEIDFSKLRRAILSADVKFPTVLEVCLGKASFVAAFLNEDESKKKEIREAINSEGFARYEEKTAGKGHVTCTFSYVGLHGLYPKVG